MSNTYSLQCIQEDHLKTEMKHVAGILFKRDDNRFTEQYPF